MRRFPRDATVGRWRRLAVHWSSTSWAQLALVFTAVLVTAAMVIVAQTGQIGAQRHERAEILLETIRADSEELDAIRGEALSAVQLHSTQRIMVSTALLDRGWSSVDQLYASLNQLNRIDRPLATRLRADAQTILSLGTSIFHAATGKRVQGRFVAAQQHFSQLVNRLDRDTQSAVARESRVAAQASSAARTAFIGSLVLGLLALLLIATRVHRMRRRIAVEEVQQAMESRSEARLRALLEHAGDIVTVVGTDLRVRWQAASITRILGHGASDLLGRPLVSLVHPDEVALVEHFLTSGLTSSSDQALTVRLRHADGRWRAFDVVANNRVADPAIGGLVLSMRDATERTELEEELRHQAYHDPLTGLANRSLFENRLAQAVAIGRRSERAFAVMFLDIDDFKMINDSLGHAHGDDLLRAVAERIALLLRPTDTAARLGGDEFAVLLETDAPDAGALAVAERILESLSYPFAIGDRELRVTASIGVALTSPETRVDDLLRNADIAMYAAKADGGNAVRTFQPDMHDRALERLELTGELRAAIDAEEFVLEYQPIVRPQSGRIVAVEALVRWRHPRRELVGPKEFIGISEDTGLIVPLGRWILQTACEQGGRWHRERPDQPLHLRVNVSTRQLSEAAFVDDVRRTLAATGFPPRLLTLEITEGVLIGDTNELIERLQALRELGIRIAIDDFGTGYSSLSHLRHLPVDTLKIDRSFVDEVEIDPAQAKLVRGIVTLAESLELEVVYEGIERAAQLDELLWPGTPLVQGFLFHRPLPAEEISRLLGQQPAGAIDSGASEVPTPESSLSI